MRWYSWTIPIILFLFQLPFGVLSKDAESTSAAPAPVKPIKPTKPEPPEGTNCKAVDIHDPVLSLFLDKSSIISLDRATQEDIDALSDLIVDGFNAWHCTFPIKMHRNAVVTTLKLPPRVYGLEVTENPKLEEITVPLFVSGSAKIHGNNLLNDPEKLKEIDKFCPPAQSGKASATFSKCDIRYDECYFAEKELINIKELDGCTDILSDLVLKGGTTTTKLKHVKCLSMISASISNFAFMDDLEHVECEDESGATLDRNSMWCMTYAETKKFRGLGFTVTENYAPHCEKLFCTSSEFTEAFPTEPGACGKVTESLTLDCSDENVKTKAFSITLLSGTLTLEQCSGERTTKILSYFKEIDAGTGVAVVLKNPADNLQTLKISPNTRKMLKGTTLLKVDSVNQFGLIEASKVKLALGKEKKNKVVFTNAVAEPKGGCFEMEAVTVLFANCTIMIGDLILDKNTKAISTSLKEVHGCLRMSYTTSLQNYDFLKNLTLGPKCLLSDAHSSIRSIPCIPLSIRRQLDTNMMTMIMDVENHNNYNCECFFNSPAKEVPENCNMIDGDLIVDGETQTITKSIKEVTGCIRVSSERASDFTFLQGIETFNDQCLYRNDSTAIEAKCIPPSVLKALKPNLRVLIPGEPPREECGECQGDKVGIRCKIVYGDVRVSTGIEKEMSNVEEIIGSLIIEKNIADHLNFPKLRKIALSTVGRHGVSLLIVDNDNLVSIELPALESISINGRTSISNLIKIERNPRWEASDTLMKKIEMVVGSACSEEPEAVCSFRRYVKPRKEKAEEDEEKLRKEGMERSEKEEAKKKDGDSNVGKIVGITLPIFAVALLVVGGIVGSCIYIRKRRKRAKEAEEKKELERKLIKKKREEAKIQAEADMAPQIPPDTPRTHLTHEQVLINGEVHAPKFDENGNQIKKEIVHDTGDDDGKLIEIGYTPVTIAVCDFEYSPVEIEWIREEKYKRKCARGGANKARDEPNKKPKTRSRSTATPKRK